jgi:xylitol oxidase
MTTPPPNPRPVSPAADATREGTGAAAPRNWAGNITFGAAALERPASLDELRRTVAAAPAVRALGTGHSFNRVADTGGTLVRLDAMPATVEVDRDAATVTVAAGLRYAHVAEHLYGQGLALANMASLPQISVAGATATGTHGSGDGLGGLGTSVAGLRLVGPDGEVTELRRDRAADRLAGAVVSLGALGVVSEVVLDVEPAFEVAQWVYLGLPLDVLGGNGDGTDLGGFDAVFGAAYSVSVFTDWISGTGRVWLKRRADREGAGHPGERWLGARLADAPEHPLPGMPPLYCTEQLGVPGPWHERLPHFRPDFTPSSGEELQSEVLLPREAAPRAVAALRGLADRIAPVLQISEIRTVAGDGLWLSPSQGRDSVALHFTWVKDTAAVLPVVAAIEAELLPLGGRPHWGKVSAADPASLAGAYGRAGDFEALMREHDPAGKFRNAYVDGVFPAGR